MSYFQEMDKRKLYSGMALLPLLVSHPILTTLSKDPNTKQYLYQSTVAVMMIEVFKLCFGSLFYVQSFGFSSPLHHSGYASWSQFLRKSVNFSVPAIVYGLANNFVFLALNYLDPAVAQLLNNLKILSTALLSWLILEKKLSLVQWTSLLVLTCGAAVTQLKTPCLNESVAAGDTAVSHGENRVFGVIIALLATLCSGIAGVWTEYVMKGRGVVKDQPIQLQNLQLYFYGVFFHIMVVWYNSGEIVADRGLFYGFGFWAWAAVFNQVFLGFSVSFLMKYADNIVKVFINCVAMVVVAILSSYLFGTELGAQLLVAIVLVASSIVLYNA
jgi:solute carrier family 35 (UDP-sugar transporter), member A1/2/3